MTKKVLKAMEPFVGKTKGEVAAAWEEVATTLGWDGRDARLRLDNLEANRVDHHEDV